MREMKLGSFVEDLEKEADYILDDFSVLSHGTRVLLLLKRAKEGGHNKEYKRRRAWEVVHDKEQLRRALVKLLILQKTLGTDERIYMSVSPRDIRKAEMDFKETMLRSDFGNDENKRFFYEHFEEKWVSSLMSSNPPKGEMLFILDIDTSDNGKALSWCAENNVEIVKSYRTKNGWHIIVKPFNQSLFPKKIGEVKKDGLLLLSF